ncbi:LemA family protein [Patescibacteria group bacterium]|nr:LemA family protein [Patescibacteria group bacterium]
MKKGWWILIVILVILFGLYSAGKNYYNDIIVMEEQITTQDAQVQNVYERRVDLVPQVAAVVKKYTQYEGSTLSGIVALRSQSANLDQLNAMIAQGQYKSSDFSSLLASTLGGLKVTVEAYPELKADQQFNNLYVTLEGSENRIRTEIMNYNNMIVAYNLKVRSFPRGKIFSGLFGFEQKERITPPADKDIKAVPDVDAMLE